MTSGLEATDLFAWSLQIQAEALGSAVLRVDKTGGQVNGKTQWLWCFTTTDLTDFMTNRSRGTPALAEFFRAEFNGTLVTDFRGAYNKAVCARRQTCLVHLLRESKTVDKYSRPGLNWPGFVKKRCRLLGDAIRLKQRDEMSADRSMECRKGDLAQPTQCPGEMRAVSVDLQPGVPPSDFSGFVQPFPPPSPLLALTQRQ